MGQEASLEKPPTLCIPVKMMDQQDLEEQAQELRQICDRLDPFAPAAPQMQEALEKYLPNPRQQDPFALTNQLIVLLEDTLDELRQRTEKQP